MLKSPSSILNSIKKMKSNLRNDKQQLRIIKNNFVYLQHPFEDTTKYQINGNKYKGKQEGKDYLNGVVIEQQNHHGYVQINSNNNNNIIQQQHTQKTSNNNVNTNNTRSKSLLSINYLRQKSHLQQQQNKQNLNSQSNHASRVSQLSSKTKNNNNRKRLYIQEEGENILRDFTNFRRDSLNNNNKAIITSTSKDDKLTSRLKNNTNNYNVNLYKDKQNTIINQPDNIINNEITNNISKKQTLHSNNKMKNRYYLQIQNLKQTYQQQKQIIISQFKSQLQCQQSRYQLEIKQMKEYIIMLEQQIQRLGTDEGDGGDVVDGGEERGQTLGQIQQSFGDNNNNNNSNNNNQPQTKQTHHSIAIQMSLLSIKNNNQSYYKQTVNIQTQTDLVQFRQQRIANIPLSIQSQFSSINHQHQHQHQHQQFSKFKDNCNNHNEVDHSSSQCQQSSSSSYINNLQFASNNNNSTQQQQQSHIQSENSPYQPNIKGNNIYHNQLIQQLCMQFQHPNQLHDIKSSSKQYDSLLQSQQQQQFIGNDNMVLNGYQREKYEHIINRLLEENTKLQKRIEKIYSSHHSISQHHSNNNSNNNNYSNNNNNINNNNININKGCFFKNHGINYKTVTSNYNTNQQNHQNHQNQQDSQYNSSSFSNQQSKVINRYFQYNQNNNNNVIINNTHSPLSYIKNNHSSNYSQKQQQPSVPISQFTSRVCDSGDGCYQSSINSNNNNNNNNNNINNNNSQSSSSSPSLSSQSNQAKPKGSIIYRVSNVLSTERYNKQSSKHNQSSSSRSKIPSKYPPVQNNNIMKQSNFLIYGNNNCNNNSNNINSVNNNISKARHHHLRMKTQVCQRPAIYNDGNYDNKNDYYSRSKQYEDIVIKSSSSSYQAKKNNNNNNRQFRFYDNQQASSITIVTNNNKNLYPLPSSQSLQTNNNNINNWQQDQSQSEILNDEMKLKTIKNFQCFSKSIQ